uniref:Uncharacterized protein n=1 Tax=Timema genevievae TaxID=629358 RepID=A0A7R9PK64_TIMGE|nr:unnamed protein product [Timema genevievae]
MNPVQYVVSYTRALFYYVRDNSVVCWRWASREATLRAYSLCRASSDDALEKQSTVPGTSGIGSNDNAVEDPTSNQQLETTADLEKSWFTRKPGIDGPKSPSHG